jgi:hypothetical protein
MKTSDHETITGCTAVDVPDDELLEDAEDVA